MPIFMTTFIAFVMSVLCWAGTEFELTYAGIATVIFSFLMGLEVAVFIILDIIYDKNIDKIPQHYKKLYLEFRGENPDD
jgi:hypothetical protein